MSDSLQSRGLQHARLPMLYYVPEFAQTPVHWVGDTIQPSHPVSPFSFCLHTFPALGLFLSWKNTSDSLWVIPTSACEKSTWHIWVTLRTLLENVDREFPGGLVVRIPGFLCFGLLQSLVRELRFCKSHGTAKKKTPTGREEIWSLKFPDLCHPA